MKKIYNVLKLFFILITKVKNMIERIHFNEFDKIYNIMEQSFPLTEFRPKEEQAKLFENKKYNVFGVKDEETLLSIVAVWNFDEFIFIEHLATNPEYRNSGFGSKILHEIIYSTNKFVCLEVEPPENDLSRRRIAFYERNGLFFNDYPYTQPSISKGRPPIPLFIMTSREKIDEITFNKIKNTLYKEVYKVNN